MTKLDQTRLRLNCRPNQYTLHDTAKLLIVGVSIVYLMVMVAVWVFCVWNL